MEAAAEPEKGVALYEWLRTKAEALLKGPTGLPLTGMARTNFKRALVGYGAWGMFGEDLGQKWLANQRQNVSVADVVQARKASGVLPTRSMDAAGQAMADALAVRKVRARAGGHAGGAALAICAI